MQDRSTRLRLPDFLLHSRPISSQEEPARMQSHLVSLPNDANAAIHNQILMQAFKGLRRIPHQTMQNDLKLHLLASDFGANEAIGDNLSPFSGEFRRQYRRAARFRIE